MTIRSIYDAILRAPEGEGSPAPEMDTTPADAGGDTGTPPEDTGQEPAEEGPSLEEQLEQIWDKNKRNVTRDPDTGKFKSLKPPPVDGGDDDENTDPDAKPDEAIGDEDGDDDQPAGDEGDAKPTEAIGDDMPHSWSKDKAEIWKNMSPEARATVLEREKQFAQFSTRAGHAVKTLRQNLPILSGLAPHMDYLADKEAKTGVSAGKLVSDIIDFAKSFDSAQSNDDKLGVLRQIVGAFDIDLSPWIGPEAASALKQGPAKVHDPRVDQVWNVVRELAQKVQQSEQSQIQEVQETVEEAISRVASDKKNFPYFEDVRQTMAALMAQYAEDPRDPVALLEDLYDQACYANPKVRARILRDQRARMEQEHRERVSSKAGKAKHASATNVNSGVPSPSKRTWDEEIEAIADRIYGR